MIFLVLIPVYTAIAIFQIPGFIRQKNWRELAVFSCFLIIAFIFSILIGLGVEIPSPMLWIEHNIQDPANLHY